MEFIKSLQSKETKEKAVKAKFVFFGFVLILALVYLVFGGSKIRGEDTPATSTPTATISGTTYNKNGSGSADYASKDLVNGSDTLTFIQGNGKNSEVIIRFSINDFPSNITAFMIVESQYSDSSSTADADRYSKNDDGEWEASTSNKVVNGLEGSVEFTTDASGKIKADVKYRIRNGGFGLKFLKIFFYEGKALETKPSSSLEVFYVISQPIDTVEQGSTCTSKGTTLCTDYVIGNPTRTSRELKIYIPETVAYIFKALNGVNLAEDYIRSNYSATDLSTIYAINYFIEAESGTVSVVTDKTSANRTYLYTDFFKEGLDTQETVDELIEDGNALYLNYLNTYKTNKISYIEMEVDATGSYYFMITDIFGNKKEIKQDVTDVKNRSIETIVKKGNATENGFGAEETFTNESVSVTLTMTVKTNFEWGICLNSKCVEIIDLTKDNVSIIRYWRVDVKIENEVDIDAYIPGDPVTKNYASESYAATGSKYNLVCKTSSDCSGIQTYNSDHKNLETGAGFASFSDNVLTMYIGVSGRYRFYIQDIYGNNTWGADGDRNIEEYRNPRVEVYAIDKAAPEITFEHNAENEGLNLKQFDIESYEYYRGIDLEKDENGKFIYDGRIADNEAVAATITEKIYYKADRDTKGSKDIDFTDNMAITLSHVRASEYVYYYPGSKDLYSDYSKYDREGENGPYYQLKIYDDETYDNTRLNTISKNTKNNSNGLKVNNGSFTFNSIKYYHNNNVDSVCTQIASITGYEAYASKTELECVNYYLDHGVDFIIEFTAEDSVGNISSNRVYVNVVDTTPPGFTAYDSEDDAVRSSNIGTDCRMEIGQEIGAGKTQNKTSILNCYNVIIEDTYMFEDNVYSTSQDDGLSFYNRINSNTYVKLYMLADDGTTWIDLENATFIPNKTGYYDMKIEIYDYSTNDKNVLTVLVSYYVDKKIVLIEPIKNEKFYGEADTDFDYCVYIDEGNHYDVRFSDNPYSDLTIYTKIYCSNYTGTDLTTGQTKLFQSNTDAGFAGALTRVESSWYNAHLDVPIYFSGTTGVENNYVGLYEIILGTLNINVLDSNGDDTGNEDGDYIVKIHPTFRGSTKWNGAENGNKIINSDRPLVTTGLDNKPLEDDNPYTQSNVNFTIKQIVVKVNAIGSSKNYGQKDTNHANYNDDSATEKYLGGFTTTGLINSGQYTDSASIILGVLRREVGENVGVYGICNYRGTDTADNALETVNNMYLDCLDEQNSGVRFNDDVDDFSGYTYTNGILNIDATYLKSRALYVATNKSVSGKTKNTTTEARNNNRANYVIEFSGSEFVINSIDLVIQPAPGQRREYNFTDTYDPDPWEIILYGLVDGTIKKASDTTFNGYTLDAITGNYYEANANASECTNPDTSAKCYAAKLAANKSENRTVWYLYHEGVQLTGYKTNETYKLLRSTVSGSAAGSAKLIREAGKNGGWYLYNELANDLNITGVSAGTSGNSTIAVMTNDMNNCKYDETGHIVTVDGNLPCKNYNLVYNPYYTDEDGYTIDNKKSGVEADEDGIYQDYVYKSFGLSCLVLDEDLPCANTVDQPQKIYKILFEIYRREIIMEFNSAIETIKLSGSTTFDIVYGKRYQYYENNYFDINFYEGKEFYPEDYLFLCYQNATDRAEFDPTNPSSTGCTGDPKYGLTSGDTWKGIGLTFKMNPLISDSTSSDYYSADDYAIPGGVYYIYSDISETQKVNYNFKYKGGAMTIKSLSVEVVITSYLKEYGEVYYSKYGSGDTYGEFTAFTSACLADGNFLKNDDTLVSLAENVYCGDANTDFGNSNKNIYGFYINGLDSLDTIKDNFVGRPNRSRSVSVVEDVNGLQDNVGTYVLAKGTIASKNNNSFKACTSQTLKGDIGDCVVVSGKLINNYVVLGESREYVFDLKGVEDVTSSKPLLTTPTVVEGKLFIIPATLTITVTANQTKMYGCAYNTVNTNSSLATYTYANGYANCVEGVGNYYDLGYEYTVSGDKDYQIANNGYDYNTNTSYKVSGIKGSATFRPTTKDYGIKAHALNEEGTLYRIEDTEANRSSTKASSNASLAISAQKVTGNTYQNQTVGNYILTLGNVNAAANGTGSYVNSCDVNNMPDTDGEYICRNYHIDYYGTKAFNGNESQTEDDVDQTYINGDEEFPSELLFTITKRTVYTYTNYDQKIYGDPDQDVTYKCGDYNMDGAVDENDKVEGINGDVYYGFCSSAEVATNTDTNLGNDVKVNYGLTRYYTKYNSLAKAPWNGFGDRDDVQTDVVSGKISRKGMNGNNPATDDIKGLYEYRYADFSGTVALREYGNENYLINFYEDAGDGKMLAVNENGGFETTVIEDEVEKTYEVKFEIVLRQIKIAFISFDKVYGEHDDVTDYDILVCAPSETFDFENKKCTGKSLMDKHGLSAAHTTKYVEDGVLKQEEFKKDFIVRFKRVLGENVSCGTSSKIEIVLNGNFFGSESEVTLEGTRYTKELKCNTEKVEDKSVYETLAYIDQSANTSPGYNYEVSYQIGYVNITPRPLSITPDANQGFMYGNYHNVLIPTITFTDSVISGTGIKQTYGLVHDQSSGNGLCLRNIDYYNNSTENTKDGGTCFNINDRKDEYSEDSSMTTSSYVAAAVNSNTGLGSLTVKNYIFGDVYTSESSSRSALGRTYSTSNVTEERYNRNVGLYTITLGDLEDKTGNYTLTLGNASVKYTISAATVKITPERTKYDGTSQENQYKIYGEQDKELTFTTTTTYTVKKNHYAKYNVKIVKVCDDEGTCKTRSELSRFDYVEASKSYTGAPEGEYIYLVAGYTVELSGFAYDENGETSNLNYGINKVATKVNTSKEVQQGSVTGSQYYDIACKGVDENTGCNADRTLSYGETSRILLGYLYVTNYAQSAGTYKISNGFKVANNELGNKNYDINFVDDIDFTIIPRPIGVQIQNIEKTYGEATDKISCEGNGTCTVNDGILHSESDGYLRNNFVVEYFNDSTRVDGILGDNSTLYVQNSKFANGLVPVEQKNYSAYSSAESKNSEHLGVYVSRDERNKNNDTCLYSDDKYGFCEDAGEYYLRFYGYVANTDSISEDSYATVYKPSTEDYTGMINSVSTYYYGTYFGYNPNYFVIVMESDTVADTETDETAVVSLFVNSSETTSRTNDKDEKLLKPTGTLKINKRDIKIYVNTSFYGERPETYYIQQNTNPPTVPTINNTHNLDVDGFDTDRETAVGGSTTYGNIVWGLHSTQVRKGDKLSGELAYCDTIISNTQYNVLRENGLTSDYSCSNLLYDDNKNSLNTNLEGFIPIVRDSSKLSIVSDKTNAGTADSRYEARNYSTTFYPGALRIVVDDVKPVVEVNRPDVYIEANAVGEYLYECVGANNTTTYTDCTLDGSQAGISIVGKTDLIEGTPILNWLNTTANAAMVVKADLPVILNCDSNEYDCTTSAYYQLTYGKGQDGYTSSGGIKVGEESTLVEPFVLQKDSYIKNSGPANLKELVITLVSWFGTTAYDAGEIKNGEVLDKHFEKYWYIVIEKTGTNGDFNIRKVGEYNVHFYVMDNAGNVSEGNMYDNGTLKTTYKNVGKLHIVDTTKPVVGTLNLYNGKVSCPTPENTSVDCTVESNWKVTQDTYVPINTLRRYDANGNPSSTGDYVVVDTLANKVSLSSQDKYTRTDSPTGAVYTKDNTLGKYIKIPSGASAEALKHYGWSNSNEGIWLTITGGSDNSYTETSFPAREAVDSSQWQHYYSRDGGITWFLYDRTSKDSVLALDAEGSREIMIRAVDKGVKLTESVEGESSYIDKFYGSGNTNNTTKKMTKYAFADTTIHDKWLLDFESLTDEEKVSNEPTRHDKLNYVGWNVSADTVNDTTIANTISLLIYGKEAATSGYKYYRDKQTAYLDTVSPVISFGEANGEKLYVFEYGCASCTKGYTEHYAGARDSYPTSNTSREVASAAYNKNNSIVINHTIFDKNVAGSGYQGDYTNVSQEDLKAKAVVGGLGSDQYSMNGTNIGQDIRGVYSEERRYIIYEFDEDNRRTMYDLSNLIPTTIDTTDADYNETSIYNVIMNTIPANYSGDKTYTIIYSVIDKAGNESVYIARGAIFVSLIPTIEVESLENEVEEVSENTYYLNVEQGTKVEDVVKNLVVNAGDRTNYITQTVYYNGELVVDNKRFDSSIYDGFTTTTPGVYEITYNLQFMHYDENGVGEMLSANPIKLVINVEATPPITNQTNTINYSNIIIAVSLLISGIFIALVVLGNKKRI